MASHIPDMKRCYTDRCHRTAGIFSRVTDATDATAASDDALTIDELARRVGMTARNVRAHQSRGLVPPPRLRGRTGYYGTEHVTRLEQIRDLQQQGFNLEAIKRLLAAGGAPDEALGFVSALVAPFGDERPQVVDGPALLERWGEQLTPELVERVERLGFVRRLDDGRFEIRSPRLERAAQELADLGVPFEVAVNITATLREHSEAVAAAFVDLFLECVWRPFEARGEPREEWPRVREALERLRPLAGESLLAVFGLVMTDAVERAFERELDRLEHGAA
jgi:DNA-binding transcriptional MerR regulator